MGVLRQVISADNNSDVMQLFQNALDLMSSKGTACRGLKQSFDVPYCFPGSLLVPCSKHKERAFALAVHSGLGPLL